MYVLYIILQIINMVITCLEYIEMSGNLTAVREMSGILLKVREKILSGKSCLKLFIVSCMFASIEVGIYFVLNIKYMVLDHALLHSNPNH